MATYSFVDGNYVRSRFEYVMSNLYGNVPVIDYGRVINGQRVFYYDAVDEQQPGETPDAYETRIAPTEISAPIHRPHTELACSRRLCPTARQKTGQTTKGG